MPASQTASVVVLWVVASSIGIRMDQAPKVSKYYELTDTLLAILRSSRQLLLVWIWICLDMFGSDMDTVDTSNSEIFCGVVGFGPVEATLHKATTFWSSRVSSCTGSCAPAVSRVELWHQKHQVASFAPNSRWYIYILYIYI